MRALFATRWTGHPFSQTLAVEGVTTLENLYILNRYSTPAYIANVFVSLMGPCTGIEAPEKASGAAEAKMSKQARPITNKLLDDPHGVTVVTLIFALFAMIATFSFWSVACLASG